MDRIPTTKIPKHNYVLPWHERISSHQLLARSLSLSPSPTLPQSCLNTISSNTILPCRSASNAAVEQVPSPVAAGPLDRILNDKRPRRNFELTLRRPTQLGYCPHKETSAKGRVGEVNSVAAYDDITGCHRFQLVTWLGSGTHGTFQKNIRYGL
jgi:hypothetical protein